MTNDIAQSTTPNGNASAPAVEAPEPPSPLDEIREAHSTGKMKRLTGEAAKRVVADWKKANAAVLAKEKEIEALRAILDRHVVEMARAFGGNTLNIDGVVHDFVARSGRIFFRRKSKGEVIEITT